jgi:MSHA pilin protein MshD
MPERFKPIRISAGRGFTLIELIVAIVVIGIGVATFAVLINQSIRHSVDPLVRTQAHAIAQSYLEEILLQSFCLPPGPAVPRPDRDGVCQYDGTNENPTDRNGVSVAGLEAYTVNIDVIEDGIALGLAANQAVRVDVSITHDNFPNLNVMLSGYRADY